jgi:hypothetical protein
MFESLVATLADSEAMELAHGELEEQLQVRGRELERCLLQDHLDLRAVREQRVEQVAGADGVARRSVERGHTRPLLSVFGEVAVQRMAYRAPGVPNLYPADAELNLPVEKHSHGVRRLAAVEAARGSYDDAHDAVERSCGISVGKRQLEALTQRSAVDVDDFYAARRPGPRPDTDLLVLSADAKGIVMRPEALREGTKRNAALKAAAGGSKLATRLTGGEKLGRKRMAAVGAVYDAVPAKRQPADIITVPGPTPGTAQAPPPKPNRGPVAAGKWLTASIATTATEVITQVFTEATRRDPTGKRTWVVLIEGACRHLIKDRMDITGARWGLPGAEAILKLRALTSNGDFNDYWNYHLKREHQRIHQTRYQPTAA